MDFMALIKLMWPIYSFCYVKWNLRARNNVTQYIYTTSLNELSFRHQVTPKLFNDDSTLLICVLYRKSFAIRKGPHTYVYREDSDRSTLMQRLIEIFCCFYTKWDFFPCFLSSQLNIPFSNITLFQFHFLTCRNPSSIPNFLGESIQFPDQRFIKNIKAIETELIS